MQIIKTKYLPCTTHRDARVKASTDRPGQQSFVICSYDHSKDDNDNHMNAARLLVDRLEWNGEWVGGHSKEGMVFVNKVVEYKL